MGSGHVPAADEGGFRRGDLLKSLWGRLHPLDARWILFRSKNDEIVVHDVPAVLSVTFGDEAILKGTRVNDDHVEVSAFRLIEGGAGSRFFNDEFGTVLRLPGLGEERDDAGIHGTDGAG